MENNKKEHHESFGLVSFNRTSCNKALTLFGSGIKHNNIISLTIKRACQQRQFGSYHYFEEGDIIEVNMSQSQFAECITSMNMGSGVPCTIMRVQGKRMEDCKEISEREKLQEDFEKQINAVNKRVRDLTESINSLKGKLTKKDQEAITNATGMLNQEIEQNLPFMRECYERSIDKSIKEGKAEIEAFALNRQLHDSIEFRKIEKSDDKIE